jgi:hypothetical protein
MTSRSMFSPCTSTIRGRRAPPMGFGSIVPKFRLRATHRFTLASPTSNRFASAANEPSPRLWAATTRSRSSVGWAFAILLSSSPLITRWRRIGNTRGGRPGQPAPHSPRPSAPSSWPDPAEPHPTPSGSPATPQYSTCQTPTSTSRPRAHRRPTRIADPALKHRREPAAARPGRSGARRRPAFAPPALPRTTPLIPNDALAAHLDRPSTRALTPRASTALPPGALRS